MSGPNKMENSPVSLTLPDGSVRTFEGPVTGRELAADIGPGLAKAALAWKINGEVWDLGRAVTVDAEVAIVHPDHRHRLPTGRVGEVWMRGSHVAGGYWRRPEETQATFGGRIVDAEAGGPWLRTGDLGFEHEGHLAVLVDVEAW